MTNLKKNISESIKGRLLNLSRKQKRSFQELLQYYGMERFLFRLSESKYKNHFILKGALLFKVWEIAEARATLDIDTLAHTSNSLDNIVNILKKLCEQNSSVEDGILFLSDSLKGQVMQSQREYEGVRVRFEARMGKSRIPMQIDVGFGDVITPAPALIEYKTLLEFPAPKLLVYPPETTIAEKLQTMVEKGELNSRLKDFYDVWLLLRWSAFPLNHLHLALRRTFERRGKLFDLKTVCTTIEQYSALPQVSLQWKRFLKKELPHLDHLPSFQQLSAELIDLLKKIRNRETILNSGRS